MKYSINIMDEKKKKHIFLIYTDKLMQQYILYLICGLVHGSVQKQKYL